MASIAKPLTHNATKTLLFVIACLIPTLSSAAETYTAELTPIYGSRAGGEFIDTNTDQKHTVDMAESYGLIISLPYEYGKTLELYYSRQASELTSVSLQPTPTVTETINIPLTISYLHIGGTVPIENETNFRTFLSGGLGFTYLSPDFSSLQSDLRASFSIGLGMMWPLNETVALRLEARGFATMFNNNASLFCVNGGCALSVNGSVFFQGEVFAGLAFRF